MPFYEYQCAACSHRLEVLQKIADEPLRYCPECGDESLKKLVSRSAFRLKGGGWYETDFKHGGAKKDSKDNGKTKSESPADKSDAAKKPDAKKIQPDSSPASTKPTP